MKGIANRTPLQERLEDIRAIADQANIAVNRNSRAGYTFTRQGKPAEVDIGIIQGVTFVAHDTFDDNGASTRRIARLERTTDRMLHTIAVIALTEAKLLGDAL